MYSLCLYFFGDIFHLVELQKKAIVMNLSDN